MDLMDVLLFQDRKQLGKLLLDNDTTINANSKREMIEVLYPRLTNSFELKRKFQLLSDHAKKVALTLCYDQRLFLAKEELYGLVPKVTKEQFILFVDELMVNGILFRYANNNFLIPVQIKQEIIRLLKQQMETYCFVLPDSREVKKEINIVNDCLAFIDILLSSPMRLTKNGLIHKKSFALIMNEFSDKEELPNDKWRFGYGRRFSHYPDRFSLIYDYCYDKGWISEKNGYLQVGERLGELEELKLDQFIQGLIHYWLKLYRRPIPILPFLYQLLLEMISVTHAVDEDGMVEQFSPFVSDYYYDSKEDIIIKRFLNMLVSFGIIERIDHGGFTCYREGPAKRYV